MSEKLQLRMETVDLMRAAAKDMRAEARATADRRHASRLKLMAADADRHANTMALDNFHMFVREASLSAAQAAENLCRAAVRWGRRIGRNAPETPHGDDQEPTR